jgi:hypothetical protein
VNALILVIRDRARVLALLRLMARDRASAGAMIRAEKVVMVAFGLTTGAL